MSYQRGSARPTSVLTEADVLEIRRQHAEGAPLRDLAAAFPQCSKVNLHHIITGKRWKYLLPSEAAA